MLEKYKAVHFGRCPRVSAAASPRCPSARATCRACTPSSSSARRQGHLLPASSRQANIDGAYFGTTFAHLFLHTHWDLVPEPPTATYVPRIFGFKIHKSALAAAKAAAEQLYPERAAATSSAAAAAAGP